MFCTHSIPRQLLIVHYHLRPGGVRRVIEMYLPALAASGAFDAITLLAGESAGPVWEKKLTNAMRDVNFLICIDPALNYLSAREPDPAGCRRRLRALIARHASPEAVVWAHNLGLSRNIFLAAELAAWSAETGLPLLSQHHDLWFDNRWARWPVLQANGFGSLKKIARTIFAAGARVMHGAINTADAHPLARAMPGRTVWLPNPVSAEPLPSSHEIRAAHSWLRAELGRDGPVWIFPTRFLRRKNLAEAVLITRWLQPDAALVTTAGVSSPEESGYAQRLEMATRHGNWPVRFKILAGRDAGAPSVPALMAAADKVMITSIQEGFGLPFIEAAGLGCPVLGRRLGNVEPDLRSLGFEIPGLYDEVMIQPTMFDFAAEQRRQKKVFESWRSALPATCRRLAEHPALLAAGKQSPVPFSRLTLDAQLEVLALPPAETWSAVADINPSLTGAFRQSANPPTRTAAAVEALSPEACGERLIAALKSIPSEPLADRESEQAQERFIAERLRTEFLFPLLMQA